MSQFPLQPNTDQLVLAGRASVRLTLGAIVDAEQLVRCYFFVAGRQHSVANAILTKLSSDGGVIVLDGETEIYVPLETVDAALFSAQQLYTVIVQLVGEGFVVAYAAVHLLIPNDGVTSWILPTASGGGPAVVLSTKFLNTLVLLGEASGTGYLDGIATVDQPVGCMVQFYVDPNQPPQQWILRTSTDATDATAKRRPLDFNLVTNQKVWFRV